jgi:uncharacterized SAM-dependent methyltransferase
MAFDVCSLDDASIHSYAFQMPSHGAVEDIGGSGMAGDVKERLRRVMAEPCTPPAKVTLPDELLYSELGLMIWNDLIFTPDFYQTHDEIAIFQDFGAEITERIRSGVTLIDLGAG